MEHGKQIQRELEYADTTVDTLNPEHKATPELHTESAAIEADARVTPKSLCMDYQFIRELGHGGQAKVFLAHRLSDGKLVTVKQLNIDSVKAWKEYELFHREADILSKLNINGVAKFYDAVECLEDRPACSYIIQEYIEGASLAKMLKDGHRLKTDEVYDILLQMLNILKQLQSMDPPVIHRDIKPSNIMISPDAKGGYKVTLIDFGAVANPQVQSGGSTVAGTYGYMPPEQLMGRPVPASDIYSLGAVAVELFSGVSPAEIQVKDFRLVFEPLVQQLPVAVVNTLRRMLEPKTEERLQNIPELIKIFTNYKHKEYENASSIPVKSDKNKQLNKQLLEVESIGSPGNMELWQGLPDNTPRAVPEVMVEIIHKKLLVPPRKTRRPWISRHPIMTVYFCIIVTATILLFIKLGWTSFIYSSILLFIGLNLGMLYYSEEYDENDEDDEQNLKEALDLIENGRKTIATIVDVSYLPVRKDQFKQKHLTISLARPSFQVKYKFNPPDDAREEDLVHEYIAHTSPNTYYKAGDPLPILYKIRKKKYGDAVISMPYPFPTNGINANELVYKSHSLANKSKNKPLKLYKLDEIIIQAILNAKSKKELLNAIERLPRLQTEPSLLIILDFAKTELLNTNDVEIRKSFIYGLEMLYFNCIYPAKPRIREKIIQFLTSYFNNEFENLKPCRDEYRQILRRDSHLPSSILSEETRDQILIIHSMEDLVTKTHSSKDEIANLLLNTNIHYDRLFDIFEIDIFEFKDNSVKSSILSELAQILTNRMIQQLDGYAKKYVAAIGQKRPIQTDSRDYTDRYLPLISSTERLSLLNTIKSIWLLDHLDIVIATIEYVKEKIWNTDDYELKHAFMSSLLKLYHNTKHQETRDYVIQFIICYITNNVPGFSPCFSDFKALREYNRGDLPSQLENAINALDKIE